jgi:ATPase subunit of ABC transporter with duplicated ATPase domains
MIDLSVSGLVKSFDLEKNILDGLTFQIERGERVGLLGRNGAGKTTLFRILTGELRADAGDVIFAPDRRVGLISQIPVYPAGYTVEDVLQSAFARTRAMAEEMAALAERMARGDESGETLRRYGELSVKFEGLGGYGTETAVNKVANGLSLDADMRTRLFDTLSGGEKTRVNLGRLILEDTDILLLDEPTNHLDLHATEWLEDYLASFRGTVLAISHDRYFLDRTVTRCIEILDGRAEFYSGNYSFYAVEKERRYLERMRRYEKEQEKIAQLEKSAEQLRMFAFKGMDKTYRRAKSMEKRIERMRTTDKPTKEKALTAQFVSREFYGDEVFSLKGVSKGYGDRVLFRGVELSVTGGERIALLGDNGMGKTTLLKLLTEEEYPDAGRIKFGPAVRAAYLPQIVRFDVPERSLVDTMLWSRRGATTQWARDRLALFHFRGEDVFKSVSVLSGGELSRLYLCTIMDEAVNLLILDEPTNHLDIVSREILEDALLNYGGTLLFVSHDRYFINRTVGRVLELDRQTLRSYEGNYDDYLEDKARRLDLAPPSGADAGRTAASESEQRRRAQKEEQARRARRENEIRKVEARIEELEEKSAALDAALSDPDIAGDYERLLPLSRDKEALQKEIETLFERWESLQRE